MPIAEIELPDGRIAEIEVPHGASEADILSFAKSQFGGGSSPQPEQQKQTPTNTGMGINAWNKGMASTLDMFADFPTNVANVGTFIGGELAGKPFESMDDPRFFKPPSPFKNLFEQTEMTRPELEPGTPGQKLASNMIQGAAGAAMMNPQSSLVGNIGNALSGALSSGASDLTQKATGSTGAAIAAGILAPTGAAKALSPDINSKVALLLKEGVTPTAGQILGGKVRSIEEKLASRPILGEMIRGAEDRAQEGLNKAAYNRALNPIRQNSNSFPVGREGIKAVKEALSDEYNSLLPKLTFKADDQFIDEITNLSSLSKNMMPDEATRFQVTLDDYLSRLSPSGGMTGEQYKQLYSKMGQDIKGFVKSQDPYQKELGEALKESQRVFREALIRSNPDNAGNLAAIDKGFSNYAVLRDAGSATNDMSGGFTPSQLARAVRGNDISARRGATAVGDAKMQDLSDSGVEVLGRKIPNSQTADRQGMGDLVKALLFSGAGAGGVYAPKVVLPAMAAGGVAMLPYTKAGQSLTAKALAARPESAKEIAKYLKKNKEINTLVNLERME